MPCQQGLSVLSIFSVKYFPETPDLMHSGTPWVPQKLQQQKHKGTGNNDKSAKDLPKSPEVKRLESILSGLRSLRIDGPLNQKGPDPKGGCFCQGRIHPLSNYTPVCHTCGLPLCSVNLPYFPCPHPPCRSSLLSSTPDPCRVQIQPLIARIDNEIKDQLKKEEDERTFAAEELRIREGAFPILRASPSPSPSPSPGNQPSHVRSGGGPVANHPQNQGYSVMSLIAGKGGKRSQITVASYRPGNISKSSSSSSLKKDAEDDGVVRIRCPPIQVEPIKAL
ncbi:hypothetical protein BDM02DRAFT_3143462 [Thelephora ganbajun]|uniref:Uncharacterized protein n=1 Tax=Thelephora ganbajun TaxID=370292 RepID=A0ACB6ZHH3_THEGA|nr:hypothetical protein BDM02DRAFT_3143462 [Thelephora ganbajun]